MKAHPATRRMTRVLVPARALAMLTAPVKEVVAEAAEAPQRILHRLGRRACHGI